MAKNDSLFYVKKNFFFKFFTVKSANFLLPRTTNPIKVMSFLKSVRVWL